MCGPTRDTHCWHVCSLADIPSPTKLQLITTVLLPAVASWMAAALRIRQPVQGALLVKDAKCGFGGDVHIPAKVLSGGSADTDVLIFVTVRPIASSTLAYAGQCQEDAGSRAPYAPRRPTVGHINIDPAELDETMLDASSGTLDEAMVDAALKLLVHEVMHVLGFTYEKIKEFPCPTRPGHNRHQDGDWDPAACPADSLPPVSESLRGATGAQTFVKHVHTPKAREPPPPRTAVPRASRPPCPAPHAPGARARTASLRLRRDAAAVGAVQPDARVRRGRRGGDGTASSHWEKRVLRGDIMCGSIQSGAGVAVSNITLALFEDSGWYVPDYGAPARTRPRTRPRAWASPSARASARVRGHGMC